MVTAGKLLLSAFRFLFLFPFYYLFAFFFIFNGKKEKWKKFYTIFQYLKLGSHLCNCSASKCFATCSMLFIIKILRISIMIFPNSFPKTFRGDWLLKFLYRTAHVKLSVAGLGPIMWENRRMHNLDLSSVVSIWLLDAPVFFHHFHSYFLFFFFY